MAAFLCCKEIDKKLGLDLFVDCYFRQILAVAILRGCDKSLEEIEMYKDIS